MKKPNVKLHKKPSGEKTPRTPLTHAQRTDFLRSVCFLGPSVLGVIVFFVVPFLVVIYYSFVTGGSNPSFAGFDNFTALLKNGAFRLAAANTLKFSAVAVPLAVILPIALALMLEARIPLKSQFRTFFLSPIMVPVASVVLVWQVIFSHNGTLNAFLANFGVDKIDWLKSEFGLMVVTILYLWKNLGYNMILFMSGLANIPRELLEVADVEGASPWYSFFAIKMRYLSPTILFVAILSMINSFKVFREVYLLTGDHPPQSLYMLQHYMNNMFNSMDYQKLSSAAIVIALFMIVLIAILFKVEDRFGKDVEG